MPSHDGAIELTWGGDLRRFRLAIDQLLALQEACDAGPAEIFNKLRFGAWRIEHLQTIFRLGLIGAGVEGREARRIVERSIVPGAILNHIDPALEILGAALQAPEPVGNSETQDDVAAARMAIARLYGAGAVMGYTPQQVGAMSLFQFAACVDGYNAAQDGAPIEPPTDEEFEAACAAHEDA